MTTAAAVGPTQTPDTAPPGRYRDAFAVPEFRTVFTAHVISMTGTILAQLALTVLVYTRTASALLSALTFATGFLPFLIAGTLLSALVDRVPTRRLLVGCNLVSAALALAMTLPATPVVVLLGLNFLLGMVTPVFSGARAATLRDVLTGDAYIPGRSLIRLVSQGAQVGGMGISGLLLTVLSPRCLLLANAASFAVAALLLQLGTRHRAVASKAARLPLLQDSLAGIRSVFAIVPLRRLLLFMWADATLSVAPEALMVPYAIARSGGAAGAGLLLTAIPLATFTSEILTTMKASPARQIRLIRPAVGVSFVPLVCFVLQPTIAVALPVLFCSGLGAAATLGMDRVMVQYTPSDLLPRALSLQSAGTMFWQGIGFAVAGAAAEAFAPSTVIAAAGVCGLLAVLLYAVSSSRSSTSSRSSISSSSSSSSQERS